jgi:predicted SnoaL-like aldol condensation-catalyzing enzyme
VLCPGCGTWAGFAATQAVNEVELMDRKEVAVSFLRLASGGKAREAFRQFIHPEFRHHNPYFPGDFESLRAGMEDNAAQFPLKTLDVQRILEEGDWVVAHSRIQLGSDMPEMSVVHIFRFEGDRIVELWDVGQQLPKESPNRNGMF